MVEHHPDMFQSARPTDVPLEVHLRHTKQQFRDGCWLGFWLGLALGAFITCILFFPK